MRPENQERMSGGGRRLQVVLVPDGDTAIQVVKFRRTPGIGDLQGGEI